MNNTLISADDIRNEAKQTAATFRRRGGEGWKQDTTAAKFITEVKINLQAFDFSAAEVARIAGDVYRCAK